MQKNILITGATDGIGALAAEKIISSGHNVIVHGRSEQKLINIKQQLEQRCNTPIQTYRADLSDLHDVKQLVEHISNDYQRLDVLINNAGVYKTNTPNTQYNIDVRLVVNAIAPYLLTQCLVPLMNAKSRVVNVSSAAQSTVNLNALTDGNSFYSDEFEAYAQSKSAIAMWSRHMAIHAHAESPAFIAINPGSLLASKMVKEGFGVAGKDLNIGADSIYNAALSNEFSDATGLYFDNDTGEFSIPHPDFMNDEKCQALINAIEQIIAHYT